MDRGCILSLTSIDLLDAGYMRTLIIRHYDPTGSAIVAKQKKAPQLLPWHFAMIRRPDICSFRMRARNIDSILQLLSFLACHCSNAFSNAAMKSLFGRSDESGDGHSQGHVKAADIKDGGGSKIGSSSFIARLAKTEIN